MTSVKDRLGDRFARWSGMGSRPESEVDEMMTEEGKLGGMPETEEATPTDGEAGMDAGSSLSDHAAVELAQMAGERDALRDRLARLQAEFDNARKREAKERQDARDRGVEAAVEPFLSVLDNFGLALKSQGSAEQLRAGVELIVKQMDEALRSLNVQPVESIGAQFDPRVHEALGSIETLEHPDHQVLEEIRRGYRLRDKLLRPAMVRIATNPAQVSE